MKKTVLFLATVLVLTGCGKKKQEIMELNCTKTISDSKSNVVYENKYTYEEGKLTSAETDTTLTFTTEGADNLETFKTYAESSKDEYNKKLSDEDEEVSILASSFFLVQDDNIKIRKNNKIKYLFFIITT